MHGRRRTRRFSETLPAGTWAVTATGLANNNAVVVANTSCRLVLGGVAVSDLASIIQGVSDSGAERVPVALTGAATLAASGLAEFQCLSDQAGNLVHPNITAIQVGTQ